MTKAPHGALQGVRVVDFSEGIAGPFASRLLGDLGADVLKVESPAGDPTRRDGPRMHKDAGHSALFEYLNWNKSGVVVDVTREGGRVALHELLAGADILLHGHGPGTLEEAWGLQPAALRIRHPHLVIVAVSNFGWDGPHSKWQGSDLVMQATGGIMAFSGLREREPLKPGLRQSYYCAGINAAYVAMAAWLVVRRDGVGSLVDLSVRDVVASELVSVLPAYSLLGIISARRSSNMDPLLSGQAHPVQDGHVTLQVNTLYGPERFAKFFDDPRLAEQRYSTHRGRMDEAASLRAVLAESLSKEKGRALFERANKAGLLAGLLQTASQLLECDQLEARDVWHDVAQEGGKPWRFPARLARLSQTPTRVARGAPSLGELSQEAARTQARAAAAARDSAPPAARDGLVPGPLHGMRVIDLSTVFAAPYMGALMSDLGAEVIKIEAPHRLDQLRAGGFGYLIDNEAGEEPWNRYTTFQMLNRGKRSLVLDLGTDAGRDVLRALVKQSDILIDNFTPRVLRGWKLPYAELAKLNPKLVMLSNTGYGSTGPWADFRAQGTTLEATMGLSTYAGYVGGDTAKVGQSYPDFLAAWTGVTMLMAALVHRERTGEGQWIDLAMYPLGAAVIPEALIAAQAGEPDIGRRGNEEWGSLLSGVFRCLGADSWVAVSIADEAGLHRLGELVGSAERQPDGIESLQVALERWCASRDPMPAACELQAAGIAAGPVNNARDLICDPHLIAREFCEDVDFGGAVGRRPLIGRPYRWPGMDVAIRGPAPRFGADNDALLGDLLAMPREAIDGLRRTGVIADRPTLLPELGPENLQALVDLGTLKEADAHYRDVVVQRRRVPSTVALAQD